ncbi:hypothetical protein OROMI_012940 [Orobanche minor]
MESGRERERFTECESEGEWRRVERRVRVLERHPVRPIVSGNLRRGNEQAWYERHQRVARNSEARRNSGSKLMEMEHRTYFFNNFPAECGMETLRRELSGVGTVLDVFCPKKKDKRGKPFGFVRFPAQYDEREVLVRLNNIWIDSYKLRAYIPKFDRRVMVRPQEAVVKRHFVAPETRVLKVGKSFAEATSGTEEVLKPRVEGTIQYNSGAGEKEWARACYVGLLRRNVSWAVNGEEIQGECGSLIKLRFLGDDVVLLENTSDKSFEVLMEELDVWFKQWWEWCRPWKEADVFENRIIWTRWYGVPIHA